MSKEQKFAINDLVRIAKDSGDFTNHNVPSDCEAVIARLFKELYKGEATSSLYMCITKEGETAWYEEKHLTLISHDRQDIRTQWEDNLKEHRKHMSDLDWIFSHGKEVINRSTYDVVSVLALAKCLNINEKDLLGGGEAFAFLGNVTNIMITAVPYLLKGDKEGWLEFCRTRNSK